MFVTRVKFYGHILTPGGRHRDPEKVAAIERCWWEDITTPTHPKGFLAFTQWYSVYIHDHGRPTANGPTGHVPHKSPKEGQKVPVAN